MQKSLLIPLAVLLLSSCSNAELKQFTSIGSPANVTCYSGGREIGKWASTGKVSTEKNSDGWFFEDAATKRLIRISGTCIVEN